MTTINRKKLDTLLYDEIPQMEKDLKNIQRTLDKKKREAEKLKQLIEKENQEPTVSDHALIRYLERVYGINIQQYRDEILTEDRVKMINLGCKTIEVNGASFKVINKVIATII